MSNYWSAYWQQGHLTSFGEDLTSNYTGALLSDWKDYFSALKNEPVRIADIGTGNGALIDIAVNAEGCHVPQFYGVDYAKLKIAKELEAENISFFPETSAEKLPFEDGTINIVVSQFGIEYSDLNKSVTEVARVLTEGGTIRWILHSRESSIVKPNSDIFNAITALQEESGPLHNLRQLINALAKFGPHSSQAEHYRSELNGAIQRCVRNNQQGLHGTGFPAFLKAVMNPAVKFKEKKQMLKLFDQEMKGQFERLKDLISASLTEPDLHALLELLKSHQFNELDSRLFIQDGKSIGYLLTGVKGGS